MANAIQARLLRQETFSTHDVDGKSDNLDRIDFDAWLLPPVALGTVDRTIRAFSITSGPIAFCAFAGAAIWLFI